jgi:hypothetical protein
MFGERRRNRRPSSTKHERVTPSCHLDFWSVPLGASGAAGIR